MTSLTDLLVRLEAAAGADRELDGDIGAIFEPGARGGRGIQAGAVIRNGGMRTAPPYTASLDASLGLVERVLPGSDFDICYRRGQLTHVNWYDHQAGYWLVHTGPLPLLAALLKALIARDFAGSDTSEPLLSPRETK